jgi:benzoyl-CoA-dihydrodiol lyase
MVPESFATHPSQYKHWKVAYEGPVARLTMAVQEDAPLVPGYQLKLNSYDLGVDIELADFVERLRFEHPEVRVVVLTSARDRIFCAGANIRMLAASTHPFKVNFCKYTNETRIAIEDQSTHSGTKWIAALNGICAGGGYELALACDELLLVDDGSSAVSLPEVPLLAVLPGTGGLTRLVDKRRVRRDRADVFATLAEGIKGKRAVEWNLVDAVAPRSQFDKLVQERTEHHLAQQNELLAGTPATRPVALTPLEVEIHEDTIRYSHVEMTLNRTKHTAELTVHAPRKPQPEDIDGILAAGAQWWPLQAFRELDEALLRLRFHYEDVNVVALRTRGDLQAVVAVDQTVVRHEQHPFVREVLLHQARVLRRLDLTAKSFFAVIDQGSAFAGSLLEIALAADRTYMLDDEKKPVHVAFSTLNFGALPMSHGVSRLYLRSDDASPEDEAANDAMIGQMRALEDNAGEPLDAAAADEAGLVTVRSDEIDFAEELRVAIEERASLSPDALTGLEASLRFAGAETMETKIFGRLSAWQNWIFTRPNSTGSHGALTQYGKPEKPQFDWRRT